MERRETILTLWPARIQEIEFQIGIKTLHGNESLLEICAFRLNKDLSVASSKFKPIMLGSGTRGGLFLAGWGWEMKPGENRR